MYTVIQIDDQVEVYLDGSLVGTCEAYELDAICGFLKVTYEERDDEE